MQILMFQSNVFNTIRNTRGLHDLGPTWCEACRTRCVVNQVHFILVGGAVNVVGFLTFVRSSKFSNFTFESWSSLTFRDKSTTCLSSFCRNNKNHDKCQCPHDTTLAGNNIWCIFGLIVRCKMLNYQLIVSTCLLVCLLVCPLVHLSLFQRLPLHA